MIDEASTSAKAFDFIKREHVALAPGMPIHEGKSQKDRGIAAAVNHEQGAGIFRVYFLSLSKHGKKQELQRIHVQKNEKEQHAVKDSHPRILQSITAEEAAVIEPGQREQSEADAEGDESAHDFDEFVETPGDFQRYHQQGDGKGKDGVGKSLQAGYFATSPTEVLFAFG